MARCGVQFPPYLSENKDKLSTEDKERFVAQQECITKMVAIFEDAKYSDEDAEKKTEVMQLMTEVRSSLLIYTTLYSLSVTMFRLLIIISRSRCNPTDHHPQRSWVRYLPGLTWVQMVCRSFQRDVSLHDISERLNFYSGCDTMVNLETPASREVWMRVWGDIPNNPV